MSSSECLCLAEFSLQPFNEQANLRMAVEYRPRSVPPASDLRAEGTPALRTEEESLRV